MTENTPHDREPLSFDQLQLPKSWKLFRSQIPLWGKRYDLLILGIWYYVTGGLTRTVPVAVGLVKTDMRLPLFIASLPGLGRTTIKNALVRILGPENVARPTARHPERLPGKVVRRKGKDGKEVAVKNYGLLKDPFIIFDEALSLLQENDEGTRQFWEYLLEALDVYGENWVVKRSVDDLPEEALSFIAESSPLFLFQPGRISARHINLGVFRRGLLLYLELALMEIRSIIRNRVFGIMPSDSDLVKLQEFLTSLGKIRSTIEWLNEAKQALIAKSEELLDLCEQHESPIVRWYGRTMVHTFTNLIAKMSQALAIDENVFGKVVYDPPSSFLEEDTGPPPPGTATIGSKPTIMITRAHVDHAYEQLRLMLGMTFAFLTRLVVPTGNMTLDDSDRAVTSLGILKGRNCLSQEASRLTIDQFQEEIAACTDISKAAARAFYYKLEREGLVKGKQIGPHESRVWITEKGLKLLGASENQSQSLHKDDKPEGGDPPE